MAIIKIDAIWIIGRAFYTLQLASWLRRAGLLRAVH